MTQVSDRYAAPARNGTGPWVRWGIGILFALMVTVSAWGLGLADRVTAIESQRKVEKETADRERGELNERLRRMETDIREILMRLPPATRP